MNFDVKNIFKKKYIAVDDFFQWFQNSLNEIDEIHEEDINDFINKQLNCIYIYFMNVNEIEKKLSLKENYFKKS